MNPHQKLVIDLFDRMADLMDNNGMDMDAALKCAAEEKLSELRAVIARATAEAFREAEVTVH